MDDTLDDVETRIKTLCELVEIELRRRAAHTGHNRPVARNGGRPKGKLK